MPKRRQLIAIALAPLAAPRLLHAQAGAGWPAERPIEVIVPFPPGGGVDVMTRMILPLVQARIPGSHFVVINRAGAAGQLGLEATFNAQPNGYTIGATTIPAHSGIPIERAARYRPLDFTFLANIVDDPNAFFVRAESPIRTLAELIARAKQGPGSVTYGTIGIGSDDHIIMLEFEAAAGIAEQTHIPFAGSAALTPQLLGGHLDVAVGNAGEATVLAREGKVRALAVATAERMREAPDLPTFRELGFDIIGSASRGIVGPPGIPEPIAARLREALGAAIAAPAFVREAERQVMPLRPLLGAEYRAMAASVDAQLRALWQRRPWRG
ncbi:MAG: tripartite tricarboxylate transporter substrate binding protein [Acetobacteraceae bacterium]|nr:tripartite tricarboxylate transporter substrate binding protein [Acetobacteraceae bacterium]